MLQKLVSKKYARQTLLSIYGINVCTANKIIGLLGLHPLSNGRNLYNKKNRDILNNVFTTLRIAFRLRLIIFSRMCLHIFTGSYRGIRHIQGLPCRGQRTHANGKTPRRLKSQGHNFPFNFRSAQARVSAIERTREAAKRKKERKSKKNKNLIIKKSPKKAKSNTKKKKERKK